MIDRADVLEILANKWLMLDDRDEPRDLFDLWWGLTLEAIAFEDLAEAHRARYRSLPMTSSIERVRRLERAWEQRLAYQMAELPPFDEALAAVEGAFRSWHLSTT